MLGHMEASAVPAFVLPSSSSMGGQTALRGSTVVSTPELVTQSTGGFSGMAYTGAFGAAALSIAAAARKPRVRAAAPVACQSLGAPTKEVGVTFDPSKEIGVTPPFGFFDPLGFASNVDEAEYKRLRTCELKHARAAMMASLSLAATSVYKLPGFEDVPSGLAAQWTAPGSNALGIVFVFIGCLECNLGQWKEDPENPGDYGDPLNLGNYTDEMRNKELNNGRMAMFAFLGLVSAELYTSKVGLAQFAVATPKLGLASPTLCGSSATGFSASRCYGLRTEICGRRAFDGAAQAGASAPLGYFDPLKLSQTQERFDKFRAAEVKHGRVAMMAILGAVVQHWVPAGVPVGMKAFADPLGAKGVLALTFACGFLEFGPLNDAKAKSPGDFGDPCAFAVTNDIADNDKSMKTKELNNGRLAMLATIGAIAAECTTGDSVTDFPSQFGF